MRLFIIFLIYHSAIALDLENIEVPNVDIDDFAAIKEKCDKVGGVGAYDKLKASKDPLQTCITTFANISVVQNEIEEAKKTGSMDEVFGKYCAKKPKLEACVRSFTDALRPCLEEAEKTALNTTLDILNKLWDFGCYRDGDRLATEGGVACIKEQTEGIKNCVNATLKIEPYTVNTNKLPSFFIDTKRCNDLGRLQTCVVEQMEKCKDNTPANIVDALFKFIKRSACPSKPKRDLYEV